MVVPLFLEHLLVMFVGLADTLIGNETILHLLFEKVDQPIMNACITYLKISVYSYPALAIYNAGAAVYRSLGKTNVTMYISAASNAMNVIGNVIGVFILGAGVAWPSFISRIFSAVVATILCIWKKNEIVYKGQWIFCWNGSLMKSILTVTVPNGIENGIFQLVKVDLSSIVALFGTYQITANGVAQSIWSLAALAGVAMGSVFITVISTITIRLFLSWLLGIVLQMGVIGIIFAMVCDWVIRAVLFIWREKTGRWKTFQVIIKIYGGIYNEQKNVSSIFFSKRRNRKCSQKAG